MTREEREALIFMIALHGFELYERWLAYSGWWEPILLGRQFDTHEYEVVAIMPSGKVVTTQLTLVTAYHRHAWFKLTDAQLRAFHDTVVSTATN